MCKKSSVPGKQNTFKIKNLIEILERIISFLLFK